MKLDWRDHIARAALLLAGAAVALIFVLRGDAEPLPFLALGGAVGAALMSVATPRGES